MKMLLIVCLMSGLMAVGLAGCSKAEQQPMPEEQSNVDVRPSLTDRITQAVDEAKKASQEKASEVAKASEVLAQQDKLAEVEAKAGAVAGADKV